QRYSLPAFFYHWYSRQNRHTSPPHTHDASDKFSSPHCAKLLVFWPHDFPFCELPRTQQEHVAIFLAWLELSFQILLQTFGHPIFCQNDFQLKPVDYFLESPHHLYHH